MPITDLTANDLRAADGVVSLSPVVLTWRCPQPDLWVGVDPDGRPAGIVSQRRRSLFVTTAVTGHGLGQHESLGLAMSALEHHTAAARGARSA